MVTDKLHGYPILIKNRGTKVLRDYDGKRLFPIKV